MEIEVEKNVMNQKINRGLWTVEFEMASRKTGETWRLAEAMNNPCLYKEVNQKIKIYQKKYEILKIIVRKWKATEQILTF